jgi:hypothetical protein
MNENKFRTLLGFTIVICVLLFWAAEANVTTLEQAVSTLQNIAMLILAWLIMEAYWNGTC